MLCSGAVSSIGFRLHEAYDKATRDSPLNSELASILNMGASGLVIRVR